MFLFLNTHAIKLRPAQFLQKFLEGVFYLIYTHSDIPETAHTTITTYANDTAILALDN